MNDDDALRRHYAESLERPSDRGGCPGPDALRRVVDRSGGEAERLAVIDHVMGCAPCRADFDLVVAFAAGRPTTPWWRTTGAAVAAVALLSVGLGTWWAVRDDRSVVRGVGEGVALVTPAGADLGPGASLTWRPVERAIGYVVELRRLDGELLRRTETTDTALVIGRPPDGVDGPIYWNVLARLEDGSEVRGTPREGRWVDR